MLIASQKMFEDLPINGKQIFSKNITNRMRKPNHNINFGTMNIAKTNIGIFADLYKAHAGIEAPVVFLPYFQNTEGDVFYLPSVLFGIEKKGDNNSAFVGAVQNFSLVQIDKFSKNMDRFIRKVNSGVDPASIEANVSPKAVVSFVLFMQFMKQLEVSSIHANNFLPIRYYSKVRAIDNAPLSKETKDEKQEKIDADQFNITNKFMYLFARMKHHFENLQLDYNESGCKMDLNIESEQKDNIIYDFVKSAKEALNEKEKI